jgi:hypothetical protein
MDSYIVATLEEMLEIGRSDENIGKVVKLNNLKYKLVSRKFLDKNNEKKVDHKCYKLNFNVKYSGTLTIWEDINGFKLFFYDTICKD